MWPLRILLATCTLPQVLAVLRGTSALNARPLSAQHHPPPVAPKVVQGPCLSTRQLHPLFSEDASEQVFRFRRPLFTDSPVLPHLKLGNGSSSQGLDFASHRATGVQPFPLQFHIQKSSTSTAFLMRIALVVMFILVVAGFLSWVLHEEAHQEDDEHTHAHLEPYKFGDNHPRADGRHRSLPGTHVHFSESTPVSGRAPDSLTSRSQDRDSSGQNAMISRCREILADKSPKQEEGGASSTTRQPQQSTSSHLSATPKSSLASLQMPQPVHMESPRLSDAMSPQLSVVPSMPGSDSGGEPYGVVRSERTERCSVFSGEVLHQSGKSL